MRASKLALLLKEIPQDFFLANVLVSVLAVSENMKTRWIPITFKPRQGGVNSINLKRIMKIGIKSVKDLRKVKKDIRNKQKS